MQLINTQITWKGYEKLIFKFCFTWVLLFMLSVPFPHTFIPSPAGYASTFFEAPVKWVAANILHPDTSYTTELISDSTGLYIHCLLLVFYALAITAVWTMADKNKKSYLLLWHFFIMLIRCYLALQLFTYGFSKLFKWQFYLPEPNTLFTTIGNTPKDLLYWSTMGTSRAYSIFAGLAEVLAALLLLFKRTFLAGAVTGLAILLNVIAINFSFDISVKLYSIFLAVLCVILIAPNAGALFRFLILQRPASIKNSRLSLSGREKTIYTLLKWAAICCIIFDPLYGYVKTGNFNDDIAKRPLLHGAYTVECMVINKDTLLPAVNSPAYWKRVFIHRQGYFITQYMSEGMQDYQLQYDTINKYLVLKDYEHNNAVRQLHYQQNQDSTILLQGLWQKDSLQVKLKAIDLNKLPVFKNHFNWTIDTNN